MVFPSRCPGGPARSVLGRTPGGEIPRPADARVTTVGGGVGLVLSIAAIVLLVLVNPAPGGAAGPASVRSQPSPSSVPAAKMRA